jgi:tRNA nucleotidyltransferase (CCA-adding enzyme)
MFELLQACGALQRILPELDAGERRMAVLDFSAGLAASLPVRFACLTLDFGPDGIDRLKALCTRLRVPNECRELAEVVAREHAAIHASAQLDAPALVRLLERCDAFRKPQRFEDILLACECDARGAGAAQAPYPQRPRLLAVLAAARAVDTAQVAARARSEGLVAERIGERIQQVRTEAVAKLQTSSASAA